MQIFWFTGLNIIEEGGKMNHQEFKELIHDQFEKSAATLASKAGEYASDEDRFHNFNVAGRMKNETPEQALWGMKAKHTVVLDDWRRTADKHPERFTPELLTEKIGDEINYLLLFKGMLTDRYTSYMKRHSQRVMPSWTDPDYGPTPQEDPPETNEVDILPAGVRGALGYGKAR
jgi:hypothetical protein